LGEVNFETKSGNPEKIVENFKAVLMAQRYLIARDFYLLPLRRHSGIKNG
jgi:hypothetical protein